MLDFFLGIVLDVEMACWREYIVHGGGGGGRERLPIGIRTGLQQHK